MPPRPTAPLTPLALGGLLLLLALLGVVAGLSAGSEGLSAAWGDDAALIQAIRAPRTLGALAAGGLLGLAGALAQGLFRNPLADPYLLGSAAGASLGVVAVLAPVAGWAARWVGRRCRCCCAWAWWGRPLSARWPGWA